MEYSLNKLKPPVPGLNPGKGFPEMFMVLFKIRINSLQKSASANQLLFRSLCQFLSWAVRIANFVVGVRGSCDTLDIGRPTE